MPYLGYSEPASGEANAAQDRPEREGSELLHRITIAGIRKMGRRKRVRGSVAGQHQIDLLPESGTVKAAVWKEQREEGGRPTIRYSVKIEKRYYDEGSKEWRNTDYFFANDLPRLRLVAERAFEFIVLGESQDD